MPTYTLVPIHLGKINLDLGIMTYRMNYGVRKWLPIISWYVKAGKENILIDTGISSAESAYYTESPVEDLIDFEGGLKKVGITPGEVDWVIQTHLHFDHVGNTRRCKNARVIVQKAEIEFALAPHPMQGYLYDPNLLHDLRFEVVDGTLEIFPGIQVIHLPSHTPGVEAVSVNTAKGKAVISGMCCIGDNFNPPQPARDPQKRHYWKVVPPGNFINLYDAFNSTLRLKSLADILIPQHDASLFDVERIPS